MASVKGVAIAGGMANTRSAIGTRSVAPYRFQKRPLHAFVAALGAPWRQKACRICRMPSIHGHEKPSFELHSSEIDSACSGTATLRDTKPCSPPVWPIQSQPWKLPCMTPRP